MRPPSPTVPFAHAAHGAGGCGGQGVARPGVRRATELDGRENEDDDADDGAQDRRVRSLQEIAAERHDETGGGQHRCRLPPAGMRYRAGHQSEAGDRDQHHLDGHGMCRAVDQRQQGHQDETRSETTETHDDAAGKHRRQRVGKFPIEQTQEPGEIRADGHSSDNKHDDAERHDERRYNAPEYESRRDPEYAHAAPCRHPERDHEYGRYLAKPNSLGTVIATSGT